jgi:hypothetical protein
VRKELTANDIDLTYVERPAGRFLRLCRPKGRQRMSCEQLLDLRMAFDCSDVVPENQACSQVLKPNPDNKRQVILLRIPIRDELSGDEAKALGWSIVENSFVFAKQPRRPAVQVERPQPVNRVHVPTRVQGSVRVPV